MVGGWPKPPRPVGLAIFLVATLTAVPASASAITKRDRAGDPTVKGVTAAERRALDLVRVEAEGEAGGLVVTATFRGNVARRLGRGNLRRAAVGLVLRPKRSAGATAAQARPAFVVTTGPNQRHRTVRRTRSRHVAAVRHGRKVSFFILGSGLQNVGRLEVKTIASTRRPFTRGRAFAAADFDFIMFGNLEVDNVFFRPPNVIRDCDELRDLIRKGQLIRAQLKSEVAEYRDELETWLDQARLELRERVRRGECGGSPTVPVPSTMCTFSFGETGERTYLIRWRCDYDHKDVVFFYNTGIAKIFPDVGNAMPPVCQVDSSEPRRVECSGDFRAGADYLYAIETVPGSPSCSPSSLFYQASVDGRIYPQVGCPS